MSQDLTHARRQAHASPATWLVVALLSIIAACLLIEVGATVASAGPKPALTGVAAGDSVLVVAGQITPNNYGAYLVDQANRTICVYEWLPASRKLTLRAARTYRFDRQLDEYNTEPPPREIEQMVTQANRLGARSADKAQGEK